MELFIILAVFLAFILFSNSRRSKQAKTLEASVAVGAKVIMLGGIKGKIVSILDDTVIVETTPGTKIEFVKAAVRTVVPASAAKEPKAKQVEKSAPVVVAKSATKSRAAAATAKTPAKKKATSSPTKTSTAKKTAK